MMEALRKGAKTWVAKVLLGLVIMVFALLGVSTMDMSATLKGLFKQDLAVVNGRVIASETYQRELNRTIQQLSQQSQGNFTLEQARELGVDRQVLDRMIGQASLETKADRLGISIGDQAVKLAIQNQAVFKGTNGQFNLNRFRMLLQQNGLDEQAYLAMEQSNQLRAALTGLASENIVLPRVMTEALLRYRDEKRDARYVSFSVSEGDVPQPAEGDIKKQYELTPAAYTAPEYRSIAVLKIEPADLAAKIQVDDQEVADAFNTFKDEYFEPERRDLLQLSFPDVAAAEQAKARIDGGEDIIKVAAELGQKQSDITFTAKVKEDFLDEKIAEAAFSLAEGALSAPVAGKLNIVLLKAVKVTPARQPDLAELTPRLTERLKLQKAREEIKSIYDAVEDARAQQTKFEDIAAKLQIPLLIIPAVSKAGLDKTGQTVSLPDQEELLRAVFAGDVGLDSDALTYNDGYIWYDVRAVVPSTLKPLAEVRAQVVADWSAAQLRTLASEKAKSIIEKAGTNTKLETIAAELGGEIKSATELRRNNTSEEFDGPATLALFAAPEKSLTWSLEGDGRSARIIEVSKVTVPSSMAANASEVTDVAKQSLSNDLQEAYVNAARRSADVTLNEDLWRKISGRSTNP